MVPAGRRSNGGALSVEIAVVISTFERPGHLKRCLASLEGQRGVEGLFEVVVTDDGSRDETLRLLAAATRRLSFPLTFTTHTHEGFRLTRCRNEGVAASTAPYLLFTDGDCILLPNHLRLHLAARRPGRIVAGDCLRLDERRTAEIDASSLRAGRFPRLLPRTERWRLMLKGLRGKFYELTHTPLRPRLSGNNIGIWRTDYERINGFDEQFVGWGLEDHDLQYRLERLGLRAWSILLKTAPVHLWHPPAPSFARNNAGTTNLTYFRSVARRPIFCSDGLVKTAADPALVPLAVPHVQPARHAA
jgi:glycosyltransferase involved in cell wall biosynthesis